MAKPIEEISKYNANSGGKTDSNLSNDSLHLGGISSNEYATKKYVQDYHESKEELQKEYIDKQDQEILQEAKAYTDQVVAVQDFSNFVKLSDVQALDYKLSNQIKNVENNQKTYTDKQIAQVVSDANENFNDIETAIQTLNQGQNNLFQSVSNGKSKIAGAITDKGVTTSASDTFETMATNIKNITTSTETDPSYVNTSDATATASDILSGKTAYANGTKIYGSLIYPEVENTDDATATPYDILTGKTAYAKGKKIEGILKVDENNMPSYSIGDVEKVYSTVPNKVLNETYDAFNRLGNNPYLNRCTIFSDGNGNIIGCVKVVPNETAEEDGTYKFSIFTYLYSKDIYGETGFVNEKEYTSDELGIDGLTLESTSYLYSSIAICSSEFIQGISRLIIRVGLDDDTRLFGFNLISSKETVGENLAKEYIAIDLENERWVELSKITVKSSYYHKFSMMKFLKGSNSDFVIQCFLKENNSSILCLARCLNYTETGSNNAFSFNNYIAFYSSKISQIETYNNNKLIVCGTYIIPLNSDGMLTKYTEVSTGYGTPISLTEDGTHIFRESFIFDLVVDYVTGDISISNGIAIKGIEDYPWKDILWVILKGETVALAFPRSQVASENDYDRGCYKFKLDINTGTVSDREDFWSYNDSNKSLYPLTTPSKDVVYMAKDGIYDISPNETYYIFKTLVDYSEVIGLKYNNDYYYKTGTSLLTAKESDVLKGKTFIGNSGVIQTGTLEVTE